LRSFCMKSAFMKRPVARCCRRRNVSRIITLDRAAHLKDELMPRYALS
jgi:hypothetical protein